MRKALDNNHHRRYERKLLRMQILRSSPEIEFKELRPIGFSIT
jgi:hypothetical protein